jgi:hypothetical protein
MKIYKWNYVIHEWGEQTMIYKKKLQELNSNMYNYN